MKNKVYYKKGRTLITLDERAKYLFSFWNANSADIFAKKSEYDSLNYSDKNFSTATNYVFSDEDFKVIKKELSLPMEQFLIEMIVDEGTRGTICTIYSQSKFDTEKKQFDFIQKQPKMSMGSLMSIASVLSLPSI